MYIWGLNDTCKIFSQQIYENSVNKTKTDFNLNAKNYEIHIQTKRKNTSNTFYLTIVWTLCQAKYRRYRYSSSLSIYFLVISSLLSLTTVLFLITICVFYEIHNIVIKLQVKLYWLLRDSERNVRLCLNMWIWKCVTTMVTKHFDRF